MVRINLIDPKRLSDQHLIAEYGEILMLFAYVKKNPEVKDIPADYCLGKGHEKFFKNKLRYLKKRHERIKKEMRKRGFKAGKRIDLSGFSRKLANDWKPGKDEKSIIKKRLIEKVKPGFRYYSKVRPKKFFTDMIKKE